MGVKTNIRPLTAEEAHHQWLVWNIGATKKAFDEFCDTMERIIREGEQALEMWSKDHPNG